MSYTPHLRRENGYSYGGSLKHYRTKGSRNGYSNDPNYKPVGQRAQGKLIDGRYVYEGAKAKSSNRLNGNNGVIYEKRIKEKIIPEKRIFEKRTPSPSKPIRTQPQPKQNWFQRGVSSVGKAATSAGNWLGDRGRDAGKAVGSAASNAGRSIGKAATSAGNWLGDRGRDAGKAVGKAASDTSKWAGDRAKDVGKAVGKAGANVKDWATGGEQHRKNAQKARYDSKYQREYGFEKGTDKHDNSQKSLSKPGQFGYTGREIREASEASENRAKVLDKKARDEQKKFDKSATGKLENVKGIMSGYTKNTRKAISEHGDGWLKDGKPKNLLDRFTGDSYKNSSDRKKSILNDVEDLKSKSKDFWKGLSGVKEANYLDSEYGALRKKAKLFDEQYENAPRQKLSRAKTDASKWISDRFGEAKSTAKKAGEAVGSAASKAGKAVGKAAKDTWEFTKPGGTLDKAAVGAAKKAGEAVGKATDDAKKAAGDFVNGLFSKKEKKSSNAKPIETKPIETKPIETKPIETKPIETKPIETKPIETKPIESKRNRSKSSNKSSKAKTDMSDKPKGVSDEYWEEYKSNGGTRKEYDSRAKSSNKSSKSTTDMSDKPKGVSDEYWEEYKSNGGTRDQWNSESKSRKASNKNKSSKEPYRTSEYERALKYNSKENNYFGTGSISNKPNFDHYTYDEKTGKTVWVDKNGKKHSK